MSGKDAAVVHRRGITRGQGDVARRDPEARDASTHDEGLAAARALIERDFCNRGLKLADLARAANLSEFYFHRLFRKRYGTTTKQLVVAMRVAEVQRLARAGCSFRDAAGTAGFAHQSHMTVQFRRAVGMTPRQWLLKERRNASIER